jgi:tRNA A-37 threonylcarbamoyl transferase component Bud32
MEYVDGRTLLELLGESGPFGEKQALKIVLEVAEALAYLEQNQLIHGDVKPGNILLASDGRSKLFDLGFAAGLGEKGADDSAMGTRFYIATREGARRQRRGRAQRHLQHGRDAVPPGRRPAAVRQRRRLRGAAQARRGDAALARAQEPRLQRPTCSTSSTR